MSEKKKTTEQTEQEQVNENNCNTEKTREAISDLYKNVTMAQNSIKVLLPYVNDAEFTRSLHKQVEQYDHYVEKTDELAKTLNFDPTPAPKTALMMASMGIRMKMIADGSQEHAAKIMVQGIMNGIIDMYRLIKDNPDVHPDVTLLMKQVLRYEEGALESMKPML